MNLGHLRRLEHIRDLHRVRHDGDAANPRLLCFSGMGFAEHLRETGDRDHTIQLIDPYRLYHGA